MSLVIPKEFQWNKLRTAVPNYLNVVRDGHEEYLFI